MSIDSTLMSRLNPDPAKRIDEVIAHYRRERQPAELFEALKMKSRLAHGLSMVADPDEPMPVARTEAEKQRERDLEEGLLDACRQAGAMLIQDGRVAEGWMYLRPTGDVELARRLLSDIDVTDENYDDMIQVLLHESVDLRRGYNAVLTHQGTCNSITLYDQAIASRSKADRKIASECLLVSFYDELLSLVRDDFRSRGPKNDVDAATIDAEAETLSLGDLIAKHKWILGTGGYHLDTTHLSSTVRFATVLDDSDLIDKALQLCQYGRRLPADFQYPGEEPFVDFYPAHVAFFGALLGLNVETAVRMFEQKARTVDINVAGAGAIEIYIDLLDRIGRPAEALRAAIELFPAEVPTQRVLPELLAMARRAKAAGDTTGLDALEKFCFDRGDLLAVAAIAAERS